MPTETESAQPYTDPHEVRKAIQTLVATHEKDEQRTSILSRLSCSGRTASTLVGRLIGNLHRRDAHLKCAIFQLIQDFHEQGLNVSEAADGLGSFLSTPDDAVRNSALRALAAMGPVAKGAEERAIGCLRNTDQAIKQAGAIVLRAIGPACSRGALPKIKRALENQNSETTAMLLTATAKQILNRQPARQ